MFIGDTIYTVRTHLSKTPNYDEMGFITVRYEMYKQPGDLVMYCEHLPTVKYSHPENFKPKSWRMTNLIYCFWHFKFHELNQFVDIVLTPI